MINPSKVKYLSKIFQLYTELPKREYPCEICLRFGIHTPFSIIGKEAVCVENANGYSYTNGLGIGFTTSVVFFCNSCMEGN